ncbi:hypothetical protein A2973_00340 [Candidatus Gottesmanbacteria bacterium RIFCSPLOWO2_01_FULL_49_10]|uniref:Stress-response A/B barrel domain-containing protein n=1 Tax=Candidatus Gottesmanbacteria bacterium RIFCSPLOWO2_01_FULL_49_10 TaxID=1798396 RepID=A0A1F6AYQ7_9BACT|nr:MAG: hypothetical protein A2973_00340 [Candidatus Gottesmanbacteria bacterium RIFCSPLOWO2_01_FULL_49_10]
MIHHVVLFKFNANATPEKIDEMAKVLVDLKDKIPGIIKYVWGPSVSIEPYGKGYTHAFIMTFDTKEHRDAYVPHPLHKELVKKYVDPICDDGLVVDLKE